MKKKSNVTAEQIESSLAKWCEVLSAGQAVAEEVPPGWFTVKQLAEARNRSECITSEQVRRMLERGQVEKRQFTIKLAERIRPVSHYRLL